jgi:hypothetical protein
MGAAPTTEKSTTKLSDTQLVILGAAAQRDDRNVLPLPGRGIALIRLTWNRFG